MSRNDHPNPEIKAQQLYYFSRQTQLLRSQLATANHNVTLLANLRTPRWRRSRRRSRHTVPTPSPSCPCCCRCCCCCSMSICPNLWWTGLEMIRYTKKDRISPTIAFSIFFIVICIFTFSPVVGITFLFVQRIPHFSNVFQMLSVLFFEAKKIF